MTTTRKLHVAPMLALPPRPDGTLGALALWNAELRAGLRTAAQLDSLARAAMYDAAARDAGRSARACDARAAHAETTADVVRFRACAATDRRDAAEYRGRAAIALLAEATQPNVPARNAPPRRRAA